MLYTSTSICVVNPFGGFHLSVFTLMKNKAWISPQRNVEKTKEHDAIRNKHIALYHILYYYSFVEV